MSNEVMTIDTVKIGENIYNEKDITPSVYFDYVKGLKQTINHEEVQLIIDTALKMINKTKITKQTEMAKQLTHQVELAIRELNVAREGFDIFINRKDIEKYINDVEGKAIKIIELSRYEREIPDDKIDIIAKASELFDELYIIFTDYTKKESKKVAKQRRDKDPIVLGAFIDKEEYKSSNKIYVEDRLFFITDWIEDKCELTLEEIVRDVKNKSSKDITYKVSTPKEEEEIKKYLSSFNEPIENIQPTNIFETIKKKAKDIIDPPKKKRGRPKKVRENNND